MSTNKSSDFGTNIVDQFQRPILLEYSKIRYQRIRYTVLANLLEMAEALEMTSLPFTNEMLSKTCFFRKAHGSCFSKFPYIN